MPARSRSFKGQLVTRGTLLCGGGFALAKAKSESLCDRETATQQNGMLPRTEKIDEFHLRVSRMERDLYEEFCNTEEAVIVKEMREYFTQAKQKSGAINFDRLGLWSNIQDRIDRWIRETCSWKHLDPTHVPRAREAILHRLKDQLAKTIRETLGVVSQ
jgi:hypothetical protein